MQRVCTITDCDKPLKARGWCAMHWKRWSKHGDPSYITPDPVSQPKLFIRKAVNSETDDCIIWPFGKTKNGYGGIWHEGRTIGAHRLSLEMKKGAPHSDKHFACHEPVVCHNKACINPRHLRWATASENTQDQIKDGTLPRGEKHYAAHLTETDVRKIRNDHRPYKDLALSYGTTHHNICNIKLYKSWRWVK